MRWMLLALALVGCDAAELRTNELPPSAPPPVEVAPGTLVLDIWQFRNECPRPRDIVVWREGETRVLAGNGGTSPGEVFQAKAHCAAGEMLCYGGSDNLGAQFPASAGCAPCAPGVRPAIDVGCAD